MIFIENPTILFRHTVLNPQTRQRFDEQVSRVLADMPAQVHDLLEQVPLHVEDYPSEEIMDQRDVEYLDELCGLYTGIPIGDRSIWHSGTLPDVVTIYREGILSAAADAAGRINSRRVREQIRITILHELGHHHGMTEEELQKLGVRIGPFRGPMCSTRRWSRFCGGRRRPNGSP